MYLIIDGYNLLLSSLLFKIRRREDISPGREKLIKTLSDYQRLKKIPITLVFDGKEQGFFKERRENFSGLEVIYSRADEDADRVIRRLVKNSQSSCLVVTSDRELRALVEKDAADTIYISQFVPRLRKALDPSLFAQEADNYPERPLHSRKRGNPRRLSRRERRKRLRLNKL